MSGPTPFSGPTLKLHNPTSVLQLITDPLRLLHNIYIYIMIFIEDEIE